MRLLSNDEYYTSTSYLLKLANNVENLFDKANYEQKRSIINLIVSNLQLDNDSLVWEYQKPFDKMANYLEKNVQKSKKILTGSSAVLGQNNLSLTESSSWLPRLGSNQ